MTDQIIRKMGKKLGPDPNAGMFPKAILEIKPVPEEDIEYQYLFSPIENQANAGDCVAFGSGATFEAYYRKRKGKVISVSKRAIYALAKHAMNPPDLQDDGLYVSQGLLVLQNGYVLTDDFPYIDTPPQLFEAPGPELFKRDLEIGSFAAVEIDALDPHTTATNLLVAAFQHGPIVIGVNFPTVWMDCKGPVLPTSEQGVDISVSAGGHCLSIPGIKFDRNTGKRLVTLRNSWGTGWGNKGYADVELDAFVTVLTDAYVLQV